MRYYLVLSANSNQCGVQELEMSPLKTFGDFCVVKRVSTRLDHQASNAAIFHCCVVAAPSDLDTIPHNGSCNTKNLARSPSCFCTLRSSHYFNGPHAWDDNLHIWRSSDSHIRKWRYSDSDTQPVSCLSLHSNPHLDIV